MEETLSYYLNGNMIPPGTDRQIAEKLLSGERITFQEGLHLYEKTETGLLAVMAGYVRHKLNGSRVFYIKNAHLEPTNICIYDCQFCSFSKKMGETGSWNYTYDDVDKIVRNMKEDITEIHITGGTHPEASLAGYELLIKQVRRLRPQVHIKAFSAAELFYVFRKAKMCDAAGLQILIDAGLNSIPGGGAEIFDEAIRKQICPEKLSSAAWLNLHKAAHQKGIFSNATMLYGHCEQYSHRLRHMELLRNLQDETTGFNAFIPLKYKNKNNAMSHLPEVSLVEDLRNYAVSRIFLDNIPHLKAYWPMLGKNQAQLALGFGVDDFDGTIDETTEIYVAAGMEKSENTMNAEEIKQLISQAGFVPVERYSDYAAVRF